MDRNCIGFVFGVLWGFGGVLFFAFGGGHLGSLLGLFGVSGCLLGRLEDLGFRV